MSLVTQAATKTLPEFQYMDTETVAWITVNKPSGLAVEYLKIKHIAKQIPMIQVPKE